MNFELKGIITQPVRSLTKKRRTLSPRKVFDSDILHVDSASYSLHEVSLLSPKSPKVTLSNETDEEEIEKKVKIQNL
jgi:hypothetical protein